MDHLGKKHRRKLGKQACLRIEYLESRLVPASFVWNTDNSGYWDDAANWSPSSVPGAGDSVTIDRGAANPMVTIRDSREISNLDLREKLVIQSGLQIAQGGSLSIHEGSVLALQGGTVGGSSSASFTNAGTIIVGSGAQTLNGMTLVNLASGVISWEDSATLIGNSHLINQGTFHKPAGTGTSALTTPWSNRGGTIQVDAGTLELASDMADVSGMHFVVAEGAKAFISGFSLANWSGTIRGTGSGEVQFGDENRVANIRLSISDANGTRPADATFDFPENMLLFRKGVLESVPVSGVGNGTLTNSGFIRFGGTNANETRFDTLSVTNNGTIAFAQSSNFNFRNTGLTNSSQGVIRLESDGRFGATIDVNGVIANEGRIIKTSGTGVSVMNLAVQFKPGGIVEAQSGTLQLNGIVKLEANYGMDFPTSLGGSFTASAGATVLLTGTHKLQGTYTGSGQGELQFGDANNPADISLSSRDGNGNNQTSDASFNFTPGFAHFRRGWIESINGTAAGYGTLTNAGSLTFDQNGNDIRIVNSIAINNTGSMFVANAAGTTLYMQSSVINNTGTLEFTDDSNVTIGYSSATIQNRGLLLKSGGAGVTTVGGVIMRPEGTVEARAGTLELRGFGGAPASTGGAFAASNGATILLTESHYLQGSYSGTGLGTVQIGTTDTSYPNAAIRVEQAGASLNFHDGILHFVRGSIYSDNIQNVGFSTITNNGTMSIDGGEANFSGFAGINNSGNLIVSRLGQMRLFNGTLRNHAGGIVDLQGDNGVVGNGSIDNRGTLRRSTSVGNAVIATTVTLRKEGVIDVRSGSLNLSGDYSVLEGGSFQVATDAELRATGYSPTFGGELTGSGGGRLTLTRAALLDPAGVSLDFPTGMLHVSGGGFYTANNTRADIVNRGFLSIDSGGSRQESGFTRIDMRNLGTITVADAGFRLNGSSTLYNTGTLELRDGAEIIRDNGSVTNRGRIVKAGTGTASFPGSLDNQGVVEVPEGILTFSQYGSTRIGNYSNSNGGTLTGGTWKVSGAGKLDLGQLENSTDPVAILSNATIQVDGTAAYFDGLNSLKSNSGTITFSGGADLTLSNIDFANAGLLALGSGSVLSVKSFTQAATGGLGIGIGGLPTDLKFGKVTATQAVSLAGALKVEIEGGFGIIPDQTYSFIAATSVSGQFDSATGLKLGRVTLMALRESANSRDIVTLLPAPDIAVSAVSATTSGFAGENITIKWTVANIGGTAASGAWTDSVYLSKDDTFGLDDILVGRVDHTDGLAAGNHYAGTLTAKLPGVSGSYKVIVVTDGQAKLSDINRANNSSASSLTTTVSFKSLAPGATESVPLAAGSVAYRQVTLAVGQSVRVDPQSNLTGSLLFATSSGAAPDLATRLPASENLPVLAGPGNFVVAIVTGPGYSGSSAGIKIAVRPLAVTAIDTTRVGAGGTATVAIRGSAFQAGATVSLVDPGNQLSAIQATTVRVVDESTIMATFNLAGAAVGRRKVQVASNSANATSDATVEVTPAATASFSAQVITPETVRPKVPFDGKVVITNNGTVDALVPLLALSQSAPYKFLRSGDGWMNLADTLQLVAHPGDGRNFLRPGESVVVPFKAYADTTDVHVLDTITLSVVGADSQAAFDPATIDTTFTDSGNLRPAAIALMKTRVGTTVGSYASYLAGIAAQSASLGISTFRADELLQIAVRDISAKDILASARGKLAGVSAQTAQTRGLNLVNLDTGDSYPAVIALDGTFAFHGVPRGYYTLKSDGFGILPTRISVGGSTASLGTVNATVFQPLEGTVINGSTGRTVAGAKVVAEVAGQVVTTQTDSRGRYSLFLQPSVTYNFTVSKDGLTELSTQLAITTPTSRDITLETGRILSGVVRNAGTPVAGAVVTLTGGGSFLQATTTVDGAYSFIGLSGTSYEVRASAATLLSTVRVVTFTDAQNLVSTGDLDLQSSVVLAGMVTSGTPGTPIQGVLVGFRGPDGRVSTTTTDSLGQYSMRVQPNQPGSLFTESPNHLQFRTSADSGASGLVTNISLQALGSVSGTVKNGTLLVAGASIRLTSVSSPSSFVREVKTTSSGAYSIGSVPDGNYIVEWLGNPLTGARQLIMISGNQAVTANLQVSGYQIAGAVENIASIPSTGFPYIVLSGGQVIYSGNTDPMGRYSVEVAATGTYRIVAQTASDTLASVLVELGASSENQLLDRNLVAGPASRQMEVRDEANQPVPGTIIEARLGGLTLTTTTNSSGLATFDGVVAEAMSLVVLGNSESAILSSVNLTGTTALAITANPAGSIFLTNSGSSFMWQLGDEIIAVRQDTRLVVTAIAGDTDLSSIMINNLPAGSYRIYVFRNGNGLVGISSGNIDVASGQSSTAAPLVSSNLVKRVIRVSDPNGNGLNGALVTIKTVDGTVVDTRVTDSSGLLSALCPQSFVPSQAVIDFNGAVLISSPSLELGTDGEIGIRTPLIISSLIPQASYAPSRGIIFPGVQNDLQEPHLLPAPFEDPTNPCYAGAKRLYDLALLEIARFRSARDTTNRLWEALSDIEKATYGELASKAAIAGAKLITSTLSIGNSFSKLSPDQLRNGLPEDIAGYFNNLFTFFGNLADIRGSEISDQITNNGATSLGTWQNVLQALTSQGAALIDVAKDNLVKIKQLSAGAAGAVPLLDAASNILIQIIALYEIKNELDKLVQDAKRFETYDVSQQLYFTAYKRACAAAKAYNDYFTSPAGTPCPPAPPPLPDNPPGTPYHGPETQTPHDPNDILGPAGTGTQKFVGPSDTLSYTIRFENAPVAPATFVAPAAVVTLTQTLDADLDASSVRFVGAGFADVNQAFGDTRFVHTRYDDRAVSGLFVDLDGYVDLPTRTLHWSFTSIDPATGEPPADASLGFLAMNNAAHAGEGYLTYSVKPATSASNTARVDAVASIVFDTNAAIPTPAIFNTIDSAAPVPVTLSIATIAGQADSKILVLLGAQSVTLNWAVGSDTESGLATHTLQVSSDGGTSFTDLATNTTKTSATFIPDVGTRYQFRLLATDNVGNLTNPALASYANLYVTASATAIVRRNGDSIQAAISDTAEPFLTRPLTDNTSIDFLGIESDANTLIVNRAVGGAFSTPLRFFGGESSPVAPIGLPAFSSPDTVTITGLASEDASIKFLGYQAIRASFGTYELMVIGAESVSLASARSLLLQTNGGDDFASINNSGISANFNTSGPSAGSSIAFSSVPSVTIDLGFDDTSENRNSFAISNVITATGLKSVTVLGGTGSDMFSILNGGSTALPVAGGGYTFNGGTGTDTIRTQGNANWTLTNSLITSSLGHRVTLTGVESADITGGAGNNILDASLFTGTTVLQGGLGNDILKGGKGRDTVREYGDKATNFTLTNSRLTGMGTDTLSGIENADFVGGSGNNTFDLSLFTGTATIDCYAGGTDTVKGSAGVTTVSAADYGTAHNFTLTSTRLSHPAGIVNFTSVEKFELFGGASANTFDVSTYTGSTILHGGGGIDTVVAMRDASFTLSDSLLSVTGGGTHTLDGIKAVRLTGGASANSFTIGAWTGQATVNGSTGTDTLVASGDFNFALGAASLSISSGASVAFSAIEKARLTGGNSANTLDASLFTGSVMLFGLDGNDTIKGSKGASVLVGGNGSDSLFAGTGRSIFIGGTGADSITGGVADDLLIHGSTRYDANTTALDALLAEWSRTTASYALRLSHLRTGTGGLNGANKLAGAITDDLAIDSLVGAGGQDWFFGRVTAPADILSDRASNENLN